MLKGTPRNRSPLLEIENNPVCYLSQHEIDRQRDKVANTYLLIDSGSK